MGKKGPTGDESLKCLCKGRVTLERAT